jgi:hypothetical protein
LGRRGPGEQRRSVVLTVVPGHGGEGRENSAVPRHGDECRADSKVPGCFDLVEE